MIIQLFRDMWELSILGKVSVTFISLATTSWILFLGLLIDHLRKCKRERELMKKFPPYPKEIK